MSTGCTAERLGQHDYSQPPHNTPEIALPACEDPDCRHHFGDDCHAALANQRFGGGQHDTRYEIVLYQVGTHDWITLRACEACTATLRWQDTQVRRAGIYSVRSLRPVAAVSGLPTKPEGRQQ